MPWLASFALFVSLIQQYCPTFDTLTNGITAIILLTPDMLGQSHLRHNASKHNQSAFCVLSAFEIYTKLTKEKMQLLEAATLIFTMRTVSRVARVLFVHANATSETMIKAEAG